MNTDEHSIDDGSTVYEKAYRLGRKLYTERKHEYFQVENHTDARARWMNELVAEAMEMVDIDMDVRSRFQFEAGFNDGFSRARSKNIDGSITVA